MNYQETLNYLFNKLPMFSRIGAAAFKKDLTNTIALCAALGNPQNKIKTIHIAGTNGKGSTSHMLASVLQTAGYKTGLYTSPHLHDFRERIRVNGNMCEEAFVIDFTKRMIPLIEQIEPSFFEITVAMAFDYFAQQQVDIAVIEVGLGGRLDSTNIITPKLSVITNIGYDHMNMLGNTLELIAFEKAGIIKPDITVVIGEYLP
ncbi:MAG: bifunctional folylpolyglutamate synthase/dihydrofolate synthase, partial [Deinococcales bacterium]|nr:bifunctional folylpolyglutamate synthase/dihydrofolate synthase [Chitinophagaceae bacterium]